MPRKKHKLKHGTNPRAKKHVSTAPLPWNGDHGPGTAAATADTVLEPIKDDPNRRAVRRRTDRVRELMPHLTLRQHQAAQELQNAWCENEKQSSGGPLKEQVDASPKPDATIASQIDAMSRLDRATKALLTVERRLVHDICFHNLPWLSVQRRHGSLCLKRFKVAMDRVADYLRY